MHSQFGQWPTKSDNFTTITTNISKCEEQTWQERCRNWGKRCRAAIKPKCFTLYLGLTSKHLEPSDVSNCLKPLLGWKETSKYSLLLFNLIWDLLSSDCLQAIIAFDSKYVGVKYEAIESKKWNTKTVARDRKGHVYWMMTLTTNTRRSIALMTLGEGVKVQVDFLVNDDHPLP